MRDPLEVAWRNCELTLDMEVRSVSYTREECLLVAVVPLDGGGTMEVQCNVAPATVENWLFEAGEGERGILTVLEHGAKVKVKLR